MANARCKGSNRTSFSKISLKRNKLSFRPVHSMCQHECEFSERSFFRMKMFCAVNGFFLCVERTFCFTKVLYFCLQFPHGAQYTAPWRSKAWIDVAELLKSALSSSDCSWYDKLLSFLLHKRIVSCDMCRTIINLRFYIGISKIRRICSNFSKLK